MFCFQCQQTAKGTACTVAGVCGKKPDTAEAMDLLTCEMISLAAGLQNRNGNSAGESISLCHSLREASDLITDGLYSCVTNVNFDTHKIEAITEKIREKKTELNITKYEVLNNAVLEPQNLFDKIGTDKCADEDIRSLRSTLLFGLRGMAAYAHHAQILGKRDNEVDNWFIKGMAAMNRNYDLDKWLNLLMEFGKINFKCMELLDTANTGAYGDPEPAHVSLMIEKGPFIVISGHDLRDLSMLLEQVNGKDINVYTHGEMLPAHGYPHFKDYKNLKGHFGTAWHNQQIEFNELPAPILFTSNCIMPVKESYADRVYTTSAVRFPNTHHIDADSCGHKDFSDLIKHAYILGGYNDDKELTGKNGGASITTGYGRKTILNNAPAIIEAIKAGDIKHIYLVGGCDGMQEARDFYTDFVKNLNKDCLILTLACGKFRFNDLDIGSIGEFPRIMDMGQCNDAYSAIIAAYALADAFQCGVNDLPLTIMLSWHEQKAVCILLTLLSLSVKNIQLGPAAPAFFSDKVTEILTQKFNLQLMK